MTNRVFIDTNIVTYAHITNDNDKHSVALTLLKDTPTNFQTVANATVYFLS